MQRIKNKLSLSKKLRRVLPVYLFPSYWHWWVDCKWRAFKLTDHRKKRKWSQTVFLVNRDGDYFIVECPTCHSFQYLVVEEPNKNFECGCRTRFFVYLEDGLIRAKDYRQGNTPIPATMVRDESGNFYLGITEDSPWWWSRRTVYRDYDPETGKDNHGHSPYETLPSLTYSNNADFTDCAEKAR